jgi:hypothetical protein
LAFQPENGPERRAAANYISYLRLEKSASFALNRHAADCAPRPRAISRCNTGATLIEANATSARMQHAVGIWPQRGDFVLTVKCDGFNVA